MNTYQIHGTIERTLYFDMEVEAESEQEARSIAQIAAENGDANEYPDGSDVTLNTVTLVEKKEAN